MNAAGGLTPALRAELAALNSSQREAVLHKGSMVVRAGPGSGKTRTLVAKAGYALEAVLPVRRGLAAITYTRHAAREITQRLGALGVRNGQRLAAGTVHGWCLHHILRPFGPLVDVPAPGPGDVIDDTSDEWTALLQSCLDETTTGAIADYERTRVNKVRRRLAGGRPEDDRDPLVKAALLFEKRMLNRKRYDFDLMVSESLNLLRRNPRVTQLVSARYPLVFVDEYQDLGPVLHQIITHLHENGGSGVVAFGDPDQTIMRFAGADPALLDELVNLGFHDTTLRINYRSGAAIIAASHTAVNGIRDHEADPERSDSGVVEIMSVDGDESDHADLVVAKIDELVAADVPEHQISILYPSKGPLLDRLRSALDVSIFDYVHENDQSLPGGDIVDFIRACAARAIAGPQPVGYSGVNQNSTVPPIPYLVNDYRRLHTEFQVAKPQRLAAVRSLTRALRRIPPEENLTDWIDQLDASLGLTALGGHSPRLRDHQAISRLSDVARLADLTVGDIAGALRIGKLTLTTYHAAKGREWDFVILPGLVDGIMPRKRWNRDVWEWVPLASDDYEQARSSFYVGLTRARQAVILIEGRRWRSKGNRLNLSESSPFVSAVNAAMSVR